jgi:hypothetical protein
MFSLLAEVGIGLVEKVDLDLQFVNGNFVLLLQSAQVALVFGFQVGNLDVQLFNSPLAVSPGNQGDKNEG